MSFKFLRIAVVLICALHIKAQTFDIEQTSQLFRPRLKLDAKFTTDPSTQDTSGFYQCIDRSAGFTIPLKRTFRPEFNFDFKNFKLKDIFKKNIRLKASEVLGTFKIGQKNVAFGMEDTLARRNLNYANVGLIGLRLTRKYNIMFYSLNMGVHEDSKTSHIFVPRFSGILGQYQLRGARKGIYYGVSLIYSDGLFIPSPFIGGMEPLSDYWTFNYTLPVQMSLQYYNEKTYVVFGVKTDGYRAGLKLGNERGNMNYGNGCGYLNVRHKFTRTFQVFGEVGYNFYQFLSFDDGMKNSTFWPERVKIPMNTSVYGQVSIQIYFGKSLLEKITDQLF